MEEGAFLSKINNYTCFFFVSVRFYYFAVVFGEERREGGDVPQRSFATDVLSVSSFICFSVQQVHHC